MGVLRRIFSGLVRNEAERHAAGIRGWAASIEEVTPLAEVEPRTVARVAGVVETIRVRPREASVAVEAVIFDGTGRGAAVWLGRRSLPGLSLGTRLVLEGRFGGSPAELQVVNPRYEFIATPREERA